MRSVSVIVPIHYPETGQLAEALNKIYLFLNDNFSEFELILIHSGGEVWINECNNFGAGHKFVKVINNANDVRFGAKLKVGYKLATKDLVWVIPQDIPFALEKIIEIEPLFDKVDCVFSYRTKDPSGLFRRVQSAVFNLLIHAVLGLKVKHVNSQFRVFKREVVQKLAPVSDGWFIDAEMLYYVTKYKIPYAEVPIEIIALPSYRSSLNPLAFVGVLKEMISFIFSKKKI